MDQEIQGMANELAMRVRALELENDAGGRGGFPYFPVEPGRGTQVIQEMDYSAFEFGFCWMGSASIWINGGVIKHGLKTVLCDGKDLSNTNGTLVYVKYVVATAVATVNTGAALPTDTAEGPDKIYYIALHSWTGVLPYSKPNIIYHLGTIHIQVDWQNELTDTGIIITEATSASDWLIKLRRYSIVVNGANYGLLVEASERSAALLEGATQFVPTVGAYKDQAYTIVDDIASPPIPGWGVRIAQTGSAAQVLTWSTDRWVAADVPYPDCPEYDPTNGGTYTDWWNGWNYWWNSEGGLWDQLDLLYAPIGMTGGLALTKTFDDNGFLTDVKLTWNATIIGFLNFDRGSASSSS